MERRLSNRFDCGGNCTERPSSEVLGDIGRPSSRFREKEANEKIGNE